MNRTARALAAATAGLALLAGCSGGGGNAATGDTISIVANASPPVDLRDLVRSLSVAVGGGRQ